MIRKAIVAALCASIALAQLSPSDYSRAVDDTIFQSCDDVLSHVIELSLPIRDSAYLMQLFPRTQGQLAPFLSEATSQMASSWLARHDLTGSPYASFYYAGGAYTLRCRDTKGNYVKFSGPAGRTSPLDLAAPSGKAEIWHFYFTPANVAHVFVITNINLAALDGEAVKSQLLQRLNATRLWLYVRNPWFFEWAPNPLPFLFADAFKKINLDEYRASQTLVCYPGAPCRLGRGH